MRSFVTIACIALALTAGAARSAASGGPPAFAIPVHAESFASSQEVSTRLVATEDGGVHKSRASDVPLAMAWGRLDDEVGGSDQGRRSYRPLLYSLILPGTGEIALGYKYRGAALVAAEVVAWSGYAYYHNEGLDGREAYEAFADQHWDYDRWIQEHLATQQMILEGATPPVSFADFDTYGRTVWGTTQWPGYHTYHPKETEKQNYYENLGKYNWFISGWEDWSRLATPTQMNTALRDQYRAMRNASNDDLGTADKFIYLSIATRVYSLIETYFLIRSHNKALEVSATDGADRDRRYAFTARSTGIVSGEVAFEFRFR